ncbi:MAG: sugar ABC transporter ATP-binding protein [Firmicutes bacterium]|nr:sugar ABC transporter ATP-binding protein [Bacillota bacterium]
MVSLWEELLVVAYALEMRSITKQYFGNTVLKSVDVAVKPGEIHALVGENGAGKSTLMNILFGMPVIHQTGGYDGVIQIDGVDVKVDSPARAMELGIGMVHQEFMLIPGFSVVENIKLNREISRPNLVSRFLGSKLETLDLNTMGKESQVALDKLGIDIDHWAPVAGLPVGYMQFVEIAREIDKHNMKVLVFDEPTAVLTESEADLFLESVKRLAGLGLAILFISHRLEEVVDISNNITVIRDGEVVGRLAKDAARVDRIAELMVGRSVKQSALPPRKKEPSDDDIILQIRDLAVDMPGEKLQNFDLDVRRGEIIGIGGLAGHGKVALANGIMGLYPGTGQVIKDGQKLPLENPAAALKSNLAFVSEDRRGMGLLLDDSIEDNIVFSSMQIQNKFLKKHLPWPSTHMRDAEAIRAYALDTIRDLDVRCQGPNQPVRRLSGGNQQKVCLGRALALSPDVLFASEPTRGIDIGAKNLVLDLLVEINREMGMTIVITSSELAELRMICDRIAIVYEGRLVGTLDPTASDVDFGLMMAGGIGTGVKAG